MTEPAMQASAPAARGLARWAGLGGVVYVILFIVGYIVAFHGQPDTSDAPARLVAYSTVRAATVRASTSASC